MFQTSSLGFFFAGRAFVWAWPSSSSVRWVALQFAELSAHYPLAGSVYQWSKKLAGRVVGLEHRLDLPLRADRDRPGGRVAWQVILPQISDGFQIVDCSAGGPEGTCRENFRRSSTRRSPRTPSCSARS